MEQITHMEFINKVYNHINDLGFVGMPRYYGDHEGYLLFESHLWLVGIKDLHSFPDKVKIMGDLYIDDLVLDKEPHKLKVRGSIVGSYRVSDNSLRFIKDKDQGPLSIFMSKIFNKLK